MTITVDHARTIDRGTGLRGWPGPGYGWLSSCGARSHCFWRSEMEARNDHIQHAATKRAIAQTQARS